MKYLIYLYYFLRSVCLRGPFNTIRLLFSETSYEKKFGIRTSKFIKSNSSEYFHYQGASYLVLLRIFESLPKETRNSHFVDIGCGMGRVLFVAEYAGFNNLSGIELHEGLINEARKNLETYKFKRASSQINFYHENALTYNYKNEATVYFLFNPFNEDVLRKVLKRIQDSSQSATWFVYMNPLYKNVFNELGIPQSEKIKSGFYTEAIIYKTN